MRYLREKQFLPVMVIETQLSSLYRLNYQTRVYLIVIDLLIVAVMYGEVFSLEKCKIFSLPASMLIALNLSVCAGPRL
jgi:hypothetical protein